MAVVPRPSPNYKKNITARYSSSTTKGGYNKRPAGTRTRGSKQDDISAASQAIPARNAGGAGMSPEDYLAWLLGGGGSGGGGSGGGGGGGGGYDMSAAVRAQYDAQRKRAAGQQKDVSGKMGDIYGKLGKSYEHLPGDTKMRFNQAIEGGQESTDRLVSEARNRINQEAMKRAATYAELGIEGPQASAGEATKASAEAEHSLGNLKETGGNWSGLMSAGRESQVSRDNLNITGAADAGALAQDALLQAYNDYLYGLSQEEQAALAGARGGGGGGGGRSSGGGGGGTKDSKLMGKYKEALLTKFLADQGIYSNSWSSNAYGPQDAAPDPYAAFGGQGGFNSAASQYSQYGTNPASQAIRGGMNPAQAAALKKMLG